MIILARRGESRRLVRVAVIAAWLLAVAMPVATIAAEAAKVEAGEESEGAGGPTPVKLSGFADALVAYTYASPSHWSRGVGRFEVDAQSRFSENVKWRLGARVDVDVVYFTSNFYLDPVKRDQRASFFHRENYLDVSSGDWNFRFGAQQIVWGEVVGLFFADVVSARDMREFLLPSFDIMRIPQWAARAEYFRGDSHLELIWIPVPLFDRIGKPGSDFYPAPLPSPTPAEVAALFRNPKNPARTIGNSNFGIRGNTLVDGWDVAAFYYRSSSTIPTFYRLDEPGQAPVFEPRFDRIWQTGATVTKDLTDFVLRAEAVYTHGQGYTLADFSVGDAVVKRNSFDYIVGVEFPLPRDTRLNIQAFQHVISGGGEDLAIRNDGFGASVFVSTKLTNAWEPQILWVQNFAHAGGLVRPRLNWYPAKNYTVGFGVDSFTGPSDGYFGRYDNRDRAHAEVRFDF